MAYFNTIKRSFANVDLSNGINTNEFLEAAEGMVNMFDVIGSTAFGFVQSDMSGNIKRLRVRYASDPDQNSTLESLVDRESGEPKRLATEGLLWLIRALEFTAKGLRRSLDHPKEELAESFSVAYETTLRKHHNFLVRPVFALAVKSCPYRQDFYERIDIVDDTAIGLMREWLSALDILVDRVQTLFNQHPEYIKGM
ncbi:glycolipid transfer protein domain-containing protein [Phycomyces nitens]|nr:glycolipid transfer protein domain-containing protein [Phycomyces nitens]